MTWARISALRVGEWYGLVWDDQEAGVTWLLGANRQEQGSDLPERILLHRDELGELFPTEADYEDLEPSADEIHRFVALAREVGSQLMASARASASRHASGELGELHVTVEVGALTVTDPQVEDVRIIFRTRRTDVEVEPPYPGWLLVVVAAMLPEAQPAELTFQSDRPIVVIWQPARVQDSSDR